MDYIPGTNRLKDAYGALYRRDGNGSLRKASRSPKKRKKERRKERRAMREAMKEIAKRGDE